VNVNDVIVNDAVVNDTITAVPGLLAGHWTDREAATGCTVILCPRGATVGIDVRGGAPGTRETDVARPTMNAQVIHGVLLGGGSAFGLAAADGVMRWLEERDCGFDVGVAHVPLVPAAVVYDLAVGRADVRPDAAAGYAACEAASERPLESGCVGAGTGAAVGHAGGTPLATKSGLGSAALRLPGGPVVAAVTAVNAFGDVLDPATGVIVAGARAEGGGFADTAARIRAGELRDIAGALTRGSGAGYGCEPDGTAAGGPHGTAAGRPNGATRGRPNGAAPGRATAPHTVIGVVATDATLTKAQAARLALMAHDGLARTISPAHTMLDGDTIFALATGTWKDGDPAAGSAGRGAAGVPMAGADGAAADADVSVLGALAADAFALAVLDAVRSATSLAGLPCAADWGAGRTDR